LCQEPNHSITKQNRIHTLITKKQAESKAKRWLSLFFVFSLFYTQRFRKFKTRSRPNRDFFEKTKAGYEKRRRRRRDWYKKKLKKNKFRAPARWRRRRKPAGRRAGNPSSSSPAELFLERGESFSLFLFWFVSLEREWYGKKWKKTNISPFYISANRFGSILNRPRWTEPVLPSSPSLFFSFYFSLQIYFMHPQHCLLHLPASLKILFLLACQF